VIPAQDPEEARGRLADVAASGDTETALEIVRDVYDAASRGEWEVVRGLFADDLVWETPTEGPTAGVYRGPQAAIDQVGSWTEPFKGFDWRPVSLVLNGDKVLIAGRMSGQGRGSGVPVEAEEFHVMTLRDQRIARVQMFSHEAEARAAAGLPA
jgi:ketosteroid isomerase-like protein